MDGGGQSQRAGRPLARGADFAIVLASRRRPYAIDNGRWPSSDLPLDVKPATAAELAAAMDVPAADITSVSIGASDPAGVGVGDAPLDFFPTSGRTFAILCTGLAASADKPDTNNDERLRDGGTKLMMSAPPFRG